jgi:hypothetical protein
MFIYKIIAGDKSYIGFDSNEVYKQTRWKQHQHAAFVADINSKLYNHMREVGITNCTYEIIEEGVESLSKLAITEIYYIKLFDTHNNGLNSTYGGDGMGRHLHVLKDDDILAIKDNLSKNFTEYNNNIKWKSLTSAERKQMTAHLHNETVYRSKSATVKDYWKNIDEQTRNNQLRGLKTQWNKLSEDEKIDRTKRDNGLFTPKQYKIEWANGKTEEIINLAKFCREHNIGAGHVRYYLDKDKLFKNMFKVSTI